MANIINLPDFYQHLRREPEPVQPGVGHFNLFRVEELELPNSKPVSYSRRDFFKVSFVKGEGVVHYADRSVKAQDVVLVFTNPMIPFFFERVSAQQSGFVCIFTEAFLGQHKPVKDYPVYQGAATGIIKLDNDKAAIFEQLFEKMYTELQGDYLYKYDLLRNQLMEVIHQAQKLQPLEGQRVGAANAAERIAALFAELLERQFPIEVNSQVLKLRSATDFAQQLNVHVNHLNKALKTITGHSTMQLIASRIMQEAKILLKSTNWTIAELAHCLGFEEPNHFSAFFKNKSGQSPNVYRASKID